MIADGTADELKDRVGGERLEVHLTDEKAALEAAWALGGMASELPQIDGATVRMPVERGSGAIMEAVRRLDEAKLVADDVAVRRPTLDDVFLALTGHQAEHRRVRDGGGRMTRLASDALVMAERNLVRLPRAPDLLIGFTIQPVMFVLLFAYVFGGAIVTPGYDYIDFLIPGIIVQNIAFGGFVTALGLAEDLTKGLIDRFRSLPTARASVLAGRTLADVVTNLLSIAVLRHDRPDHRLLVRRERARDRRRRRPAAAVRLRVLVDLRAARDVGLLARGRERGRLHADLPDHVHLRGVRAGRVDALGPAASSPRSTRSPSSSTRCGRCGSARRRATASGARSRGRSP